MASLVRTVAPPQPALSLAQLREYCDVPNEERDGLLTRLMLAAQRQIENMTWVALTKATYVEKYDCWQRDRVTGRRCVRLSRSPVVTFTSLKYVDEDGVEQTISSGDYQVNTNGRPATVIEHPDAAWEYPRLQLDSITATYVAGHTNVADIPEPLAHAVGVLARYFYDHPDLVATGTIVAELPINIMRMVSPYRVARF